MPGIEKRFMPRNPMLDVKTGINHSPHVVILGAGASLAVNGDRNGRKLPGMQNLIKVLGLELVIARHGIEYKGENFESWYSNLVANGGYPELCKELEEIIERYFTYMQLPDEATVYDYLILSLRNKDLIATFNWDPFLAQAFTRNKDAIGYENLPKIIHLHGNVAIGVCYECKAKGWRYNSCMGCGNKFKPSKLLFPVGEKNYTEDDFLLGEWEELKQYIERAYFFTIFGYSAPETDLEAKKIMLEVWRKNATENHNMMSIIDINEEIIKAWQDFIVVDAAMMPRDCMIHKDFFDSYLAGHPRRSCEAYSMATLQQDPWRENNFPVNISLGQLQDWTRQLIDEENSGSLANTIYSLK